MNKKLSIIIILVLLAGSFLAGAWYSRHQPASDAAAGKRRILYYVDPMNPSHTADKPGLAPCGMKMEPVYADDSSTGVAAASMPPGTVRINTEKQQIIGAKLGQVEKTAVTHTIRALGRVAIDETRYYRLVTGSDGWTQDIFPCFTGSLVKKDQPLSSFYSREFLTGQQAYFYALKTLDRLKQTPSENKEQLALTEDQVRSAQESLKSLGMSDLQIEEIGRTRQSARSIILRAPMTGFVLARNVYRGQRFERGEEMFRLVDAGRVLVMADVFEDEAQYIKPGAQVRVLLPYTHRAFAATVSDSLPLVDPASRTLKVRLEVDNPEYALRPDMFVDVEFPILLPPAISVPADAVIDSGTRRIVFVDRGNGFFEPRKVETGWRFSDRVEIVSGLSPGEKIVVSGNFLIDSESRMKLAAAGMYGTPVKDPVCGMDVDESKAAALGRKIEYQGRSYYFCGDRCKQQFGKNPDAYISKSSENRMQMAAAGMSGKLSKDPVCGMEVDESKAEAAGRKTEYRSKVYSFCSDKCKQQFDSNPDSFISKTGRK